MCRTYHVIYPCGHQQDTQISCGRLHSPNTSCPQHSDETIKPQNSNLCNTCFQDSVLKFYQGKVLSNIAPKLTTCAEVEEAAKLWKTFNLVRTKFLSQNKVGTVPTCAIDAPFCPLTRLPLADVKFLDSNIMLLEASALTRGLDILFWTTLDQRIKAVEDFLSILHNHAVFLAHDLFLLDAGQKPKFFKPVDLFSTTPDPEEMECPVCYLPFADIGDKKPYRYPCHEKHIVCERCMKAVVKASGFKCPLCRVVWPKEDFQPFPSDLHPSKVISGPPTLMGDSTWLRDDDIISSWWVRDYRAVLSGTGHGLEMSSLVNATPE